MLISIQTCYQMDWMFEEATSFNQPLDFNTASVTSVSAYICVESDCHERSDSDFLSNLLSDERHVLGRNCLQSGPVSFWKRLQPRPRL